LHRARRRLRERLVRRGVAPGALAAFWIATSPAPAAELAEATITAAIGFAARPSAAGAVSARVAALTEGVLKAMFLTKLKLAAAAAVALGVVVAGVAAQQPGTPGRTASDEDRLRQVEQKLDRVLQALENRAGTTTTATSSTSVDPFTRSEPPALAKKGAEPDYGVAEKAGAAKVAAEPYGLNNVFPQEKGDKGVAAGRGAAGATATSTGRVHVDRLAQIEHRLDDLERRIARLEQQHAAASTSTDGAHSVSVPQRQ
jgi:hypothetical protein